MQAPFHDRRDAGRQLGIALQDVCAGMRDIVVLGLPRGGVPVAKEVARQLHAPLYILLVRKLGLPGHKEYAMGAIAEDGIVYIDEEVISAQGVRPEVLEAVTAAEQQEMKRRSEAWRGGLPRHPLSGKSVILVDDGMATGSTMRAAIDALRRHSPACVVVAVPVSSEEAWEALRRHADDIVSLHTPALFRAVGLWYEVFAQTTDKEVADILAEGL